MEIFYGCDTRYEELLKSLSKDVVIKNLRKQVCFYAISSCLLLISWYT